MVWDTSNFKVPFIIVSALLIVSFAVNLVYIWDYGGLLPDRKNEVAELEGQIATLQNEIDTLKEAKLITRLGASDHKPFLGTDYLQVTGSVWNVGSIPAENCRLHVVLMQGQTVAKDTYINLGTIDGESYADVDEKVYYEGSALTDWTINPEMG